MMRRKSERNKGKSPENKVEKAKRGRPSRKKKKSCSSSPERDSASEDCAQENQEDTEMSQSTIIAEGNTKQESVHSDDGSEPVWHVKASESSGETGEIQKLKICLSRPSSTPERPDRSPRGRKKLNRSSQLEFSSDSQEDKRKTRHRSRRSSSKEENMEETITPLEKENKVDTVSQPALVTVQEKDENSDGEKNIVSEHEVPVDSNERTQEKEKEKKSESEEPNSESIAEEKNSSANSCIQDSTVSGVESTDTTNETHDKTSDDISDENKQPQNECSNINAASENINVKDKHEEPIVTEDNEKKSESKSQVVEENQNEHSINSKTEADNCEAPEESQHNNDLPEEKTVENNVKGDGPVEAVSTRKRRWGSRPTKPNKTSTVSISTDSLKDLIPNVEPVSVEDVLLDVKLKDVPEVKSQKRNSIDEPNKANGKYIVQDKSKEKDILGNLSHRKISIVSEEVPKEQRPPSPPKHKTSSILYITNLVRPFTLPQLKNLLLRTGRIVENGFWIDKIKSRCFVQYQTEDEAIETRHALHGVTWPVSNPKTLNVDFGTASAMREALASTEDDKVSSHTDTWLKDQHMRDNIMTGKENDKMFEKRTVIREWDVGKGDNREIREERLERQGQGGQRHPRELGDGDRDRERERRKRRSKSPSPARKFKKKEEEAPSKLLDDLFRKTKATPCIYWLPLNAETILIKEEQRRKHMAEHERRMEELRRAAEEQRVPRHTSHHSSNHRHR